MVTKSKLCTTSTYNLINYLQVSDNGVVSFDWIFGIFSPLYFFSPPPDPVIAPFWTDLDPSCGIGNTFYRQTTSNAIRKRAAIEITQLLCLPGTSFYPSLVFIATWDHLENHPCKSQVNMDLLGQFETCLHSNNI